MKKHRIREYSPIWWLIAIIGIMMFILVMNLPSTIERMWFDV